MANWLDYRIAGLSGQSDFTNWTASVIDSADLSADLVTLGLNSRLDVDAGEHLKRSIIEARGLVLSYIEEMDSQGIIESFHPDVYSSNLSVAENLLFGTPVNADFSFQSIADLPEIDEVLIETGLKETFIQIGYELTKLMLELFSGVDEGSDQFIRFSFIEGE